MKKNRLLKNHRETRQQTNICDEMRRSLSNRHWRHLGI